MAAAPKFDRGSSVVLEVEFKQYTPFGTTVYFDPTIPKISVTDEAGTLKVTEATLLKSTVGKYYYVCQTGTDWIEGLYKSKVTATSGAYTDVTIDSVGFKLI